MMKGRVVNLNVDVAMTGFVDVDVSTDKMSIDK
jgi:hypothetical protein